MDKGTVVGKVIKLEWVLVEMMGATVEYLAEKAVVH